MSAFDIHRLPLTGRHLIDASAGTGKTYTISGLVLRLLLERGLSTREILVVTYTEAATEDLRGRIRERIRQALAAFAHGASEDLFLAQLLANHPEAEKAGRLLADALRDFDEAAIFTIHAFCQRLLRENSLETGAPMAVELLTDERSLLEEIVEDYWRLHLYEGPAVWAEFVGDRLTPKMLLSLVKRHLHATSLEVIPRPVVANGQLVTAAEGFRKAFAEVQSAWRSSRESVAAILINDQGLSRTRYRTASIPGWVSAMDGIHPVVELFEHFERFTVSGLAAGVKKGCSPPAHPFFTLCEELQQAAGNLKSLLDQRLLAFKSELFSYTRRELAIRKEQLSVYGFNDLLQQVHQALIGPAGPRLGEEICRRFPAALIDEFQDTDPVQYRIFATVYRQPQALLFLIGDPKQAIYGFRGADIFAYLRASREVDSRHTMGVNYRSAPGLVQAINLLFSRAAAPFLFEEIKFTEVAPAERQESGLRLEGLGPEPFQLWFLGRGSEGGTLTKEDARERLLRATAGEIVRLLTMGRAGQATLDGRALAAGDIAVLVRTNREARRVQEALLACGIDSVLHSMENLFATREAVEVSRLLAAVAEPGDEGKVRLALVTSLCGLNGRELAALLADDRAWEDKLLRFREYHALWREHGFIRMFRNLLRREAVRPRLLAQPGGERRLTNILHLMEILHRAAAATRLGMAGLRKFLADRIGATDEQMDEYLLRLESDSERVRIVTIHKAKGLEYPIVFCPFCWQESRAAGDSFIFHAGDDETLTLDLGSPEIDHHRLLANRENLAENLRLLYVALTRARERCYLAWGAIKGAETSAPAYLLHQAEGVQPSARPEATAVRVQGMADLEKWTELEALAAAAGEAIGLAEVTGGSPAPWRPEPSANNVLTCRTFSGRISADWRVTSFSGLIHGRRLRQPELPDRDALFFGEADGDRSSGQPGRPPLVPESSGEQVNSGPSPLSIIDFPQGAGPGTFMHKLLEELDFTESDPGRREQLVREKLAASGFGLEWTEALLAMLGRVLHTPLLPGQPDFTLAAIARSQRLVEMEFYFPWPAGGAAGLSRIFAASGKPWAAAVGGKMTQMDRPEEQGFCKGYIDLIFAYQNRYYLVDWKSNFLGCRPEDYRQERLTRIMIDELYFLQYHLYALAMHRYLASRLPAYDYHRHFGGVFYLFLRGIDSGHGSGNGIFHDRPRLELLEEMERVLGLG